MKAGPGIFVFSMLKKYFAFPKQSMFLLILTGMFTAEAGAAVEVDITRGIVEPLPIAITEFLGADGTDDLARKVAGVITADLKRSGLFAPVNPQAFIDKIVDPGSTPNFGNWRVLNAQALVVGRVVNQADGRLRAEFRLWDVFGAKQLAGQQFFTTPQNWRRVAHIIADAIYERLTGEQGYFDTRIVFVDESGPKARRIKKLAIMDQDGANVRFLTDGSDLVLTPRFSPTRQEITYMSYGNQSPRVYLLNIESGKRSTVGNFPGMTFAPRFSPDGQSIVLSLQQGGNADIFQMDIRSKRTTRLTSSASIDTGPSFAPDGNKIAFESDRSGSQQIYVMNANGSGVQRISYGKGRYSTPVWSPRGDLIAFTKSLNGQFLIGVMRPDGKGERILVEGYHNEGPTWSPNGRVIMYFKDIPGATGGPQIWSVDLTGRNQNRVITPSFGSDPAWSPKLD